MAAGAMIHGADLIGPEPVFVPVLLRSAGYLLLFLALMAAIRARIPGLGRLAIALFLFLASELAINLPAGLHSGPPDLVWVLVHAIPLVAGLVVLAWLWEVVRFSVQARFMALFTALLLAVIVVISGAMTNLFASNIADESLTRAAQEANVQKRLLDSRIQESVSRARQVAELDSVRLAVAKKDPVLPSTVQRLQAPGGPFDTSDFMAFFDGSGTLLALSAAGPGGITNLAPEEAVALAGTKVVTSALNQVQAGSVDTLGSRKIALVGAFPIFNPSGFDVPGAPRNLAGAVALGRVIDERYLARTAADADREAFLVGRDAVLLGTLSTKKGVLPGSAGARQRIFEEGTVTTLRGEIGEDEYFSSYIPLQQPDGTVVGALVLSERSTVLAETQQDVTRTVFLVALASTAVAGALSYFSASKITQPIIQLTQAAEKLRGGDLSARVESPGRDEIGVLSETFDEMAASLGQLTRELRTAVETEAGLRSRFETILYSMTDGVVAVDHNGAVVAFNKEAERILGIPQQKAAGTPVRDVLRAMDAAGSPLDLPIYELASGSVRGFIGDRNGKSSSGRRATGGGKTSSRELDQGKEPTPVEITSAPILSESSGVVGGVAVVRDLTGAMQVEKMKTAFLSNVSHELRTPLTPIKGYTDLLRRKEVDRVKALTFLDGIAQSAERLERIIDMLIDFSAMEAGRLSPRKAPVDLNRVTEELVQKAKAEAPLHEFERKGFNKVPMVEVDPKLVPLAIVELVDNAVKFSPKGGKITISAELESLNNGKGQLRISVSDSGIGIGKKELSAISESFAQVDQSATRPYGGLGLGLAYIQRIVQAHKGTLEVSSAPNRGSRFTMILPVTKVSQPSGTKGKKPASR